MIEVTFDPTLANTLAQSMKLTAIALPLDLQIGDLTRLTDAKNSYWGLKARYTKSGGASAEFAAAATSQQRLQQALATGTTLRVWTSVNPADQLGWGWLCSQLVQAQFMGVVQRIQIPLSGPVMTEMGPVFMQNSTIGELDEPALEHDLATAKVVTAADWVAFSYHWQACYEDNAALRLTLSGRVVGVPQDFLDPLVRTCYRPEQSTAQTLGRILANYPIGMPNWWWQYRIDQIAKASVR